MGEGILIIRFEVPFNIWCNQCGEHIAKGVRFNAEKKQVGSYHSTKVLAFTMRHHCGCKITIQTDPKNAEYLVTDGARRKVETYDADDAQTVELPDANERAAVSADPLASLERKTIQAQQAAEGRAQLTVLAQQSEQRHRDGYSLNKQLREALRQSKKADAKVDAKRKALGLADHVKLLPESKADAQAAQLVLFQHSSSKFQQKHQDKRQKIMTESIFGGEGGVEAGNGSSAAAAAAKSTGSSPGRRRNAAAAAPTAASAKAQLQQRVIACKKKKILQRA
eukprot:GHRQ01008756.1.p1 GENE.GHRQ01008756.1~~GHRQ01008756.1.p1  ORF type:complete len:304 (+),score=118.81 GHRQ01008756.1:74-913(+)